MPDRRVLSAAAIPAAILAAVIVTGLAGAAPEEAACARADPTMEASVGRPVPARPVHTYSIVARDPETGDFGVAVQSHWFSVGALVPWAEAGVGAVATQSFVEPSYGPRGLALMKEGKSAPEALAALPVFARAFRMNPTWLLLVPRLPAAGLLPDDPALARRVQAMGPQDR